MRFVDIHTHILPGIDDGAADWEQTKRMLKLQSVEGVTDIIATPHFDLEANGPSPDEICELARQADAAAGELGFGIRVYPGCEVLFSPGVPEAYREGRILTLAQSRYVLVEFFPRSAYPEIREGIRELCMQGAIPVIAHVERYECLMNEYDRLFELEKIGALMQMNGRSLLGRCWDKRVRMCRKLIRNGFVHFLGSDCHNETERPPKMKDVYDTIAGFCGEKLAGELAGENAAHILEKTFL